MIEWIIFGVLTLIISEILFLWLADEENWIFKKIMLLLIGSFGSGVLFLIPYGLAYNCGFMMGEDYVCTNHGIQVFYWMYGIILGIVLFFLINGWLIKTLKGGKI